VWKVPGADVGLCYLQWRNWRAYRCCSADQGPRRAASTWSVLCVNLYCCGNTAQILWTSFILNLAKDLAVSFLWFDAQLSNLAQWPIVGEKISTAISIILSAWDHCWVDLPWSRIYTASIHLVASETLNSVSWVLLHSIVIKLSPILIK